MSNKNEEVKEALDKIFGDDFLEIDTNSKEDDTSNLTDVATFSDFEADEEENKPNDDIQYEIEKTVDLGDVVSSNIDNNVVTNEEVKEESNKNITKENSKRKIFLITVEVIGIILLIALLLLTFYLLIFGIKNTDLCTLSAEDYGYKFSDEYYITYQKNNIVNIKSIYRYNSLDNDHNSEIEFIKRDKLPVVVNSNGMKGFNYSIDESESMFEVKGYLDFKLINFKEVDKQDKKLFPVSYIDFNKKTKYKDIIKDLKSKGYSCHSVK